MDILIYLIKASCCMAVGYLLYWGCYRKLTFFTFNRFYLLGVIMISIVMPLIHIPVEHSIKPGAITYIFSTADYLSLENEKVSSAAAWPKFNWITAIEAVYVSGVIVFLSIAALNLIRIWLQVKRSAVKTDDFYIITNSRFSNASFFNILFIDQKSTNSPELDQVIAHEHKHARLWHSADNLLTAIAKAFFWFNPFIYLIARAQRELHEFEVDKCLTKLFDLKLYAQTLLKLSAQAQSNISFVNQFSACYIKNRINMMCSVPSASQTRYRYLLIIPALLIGLSLLSVSKPYSAKIAGHDFLLVLDAGHGGESAGSINESGHKEKDLALKMTLELAAIAREHGIQTALTRSGDENVGIKDRIKIKGDAFISIHVNTAPQAEINGIGIIVNNNPAYKRSQYLASIVRQYLSQSIANKSKNVVVYDKNPHQNITILKENRSPAILLETGYMSNPGDLSDILNDRWRQGMETQLINAVIAFSNSKH